ncbi:MAG: GTPase HflX [Planctomycetes bacterium]|nr:GTPase HflX [Planctomycetota bacterium]
MKDFTYTDRAPERVVLVGVELRGQEPVESSLAELERLVAAANGIPVHSIYQIRDAPDARTFIGKGKVEEIVEIVRATRAELVVFDCNLSPSQSRHLEDEFEARIVDRTELILDIFARRARTKAARVQVELAQLEYLLPRLTRRWTHLERTEGAIGARGPGETQLETDRRLVRRRIEKLKDDLRSIEARREREATAHEGFFRVSLVGYTNAGKSSLLNMLTGSNALVADRLFSTLDTKTRLWSLSDKRKVLLSDTVGFVKRLPHDLIASFHATLAESIHADLLLLVVDASRPDAEECLQAVEATLSEIDAIAPRLYILNQIDRIQNSMDLEALSRPERRCVRISARTGAGIEQLDAAVCNILDEGTVIGMVSTAAADGRTIAELRRGGIVVHEAFVGDEWRARMRFRRALFGRIQQMAAHGAIRAEFDGIGPGDGGCGDRLSNPFV